MSIITDVSSEKTRSRGMALVGIAFSLGFIFGPMIGAFFAIFANKNAGPWFVSPSLLAFTLAIGDLLVLLFCLRETLPKVRRNIKNENSFLFQKKKKIYKKYTLGKAHKTNFIFIIMAIVKHYINISVSFVFVFPSV